MHKSQYLIVPEALSTDLCDRIIERCDDLEMMRASTDGGKKEKNPFAHVRNSNVAWINTENFKEGSTDHDLMTEIYDEVDTNFNMARQEMQLDEWDIDDRQSFQYTNYKKGQYYDWHRDSREEPYVVGDQPGKIRKLSITILLNDPQEYEGGHFQLETNWAAGPHESWNRIVTFDPSKYWLQQGTMLVFQSHMFHRVMPVTKGLRKSLVGWYLGPPWV